VTIMHDHVAMLFTCRRKLTRKVNYFRFLPNHHHDTPMVVTSHCIGTNKLLIAQHVSMCSNKSLYDTSMRSQGVTNVKANEANDEKRKVESSDDEKLNNEDFVF